MKWTTEKPKEAGWYWVRGCYANDVVFNVCRSNEKSPWHISDEINYWNLETDESDGLLFSKIEHPDGWKSPYSSNTEVSEGGTRDSRIETAAQSRPSLH